jgi:hypothetical protein
MNVEHENAVGTFPDRQHIELALARLRVTSRDPHSTNLRSIAVPNSCC